ncbi:hypothetical protein [Novosphingobium huizhouense]|uniref:hypothetical protein n=1 Tax=Novosphingobium huizhouense TaxID=2866625 RepID=UPI001CD85C75|nr:hypothetical protein [Novosphingobium huizhouense]
MSSNVFVAPGVLRIAYAANIAILVPVCLGMLSRNAAASVFQGAVDESEGLRLLVFSLWAAILVSSAAGLLAPAFFAPLLLVQVVYKALWLALFVWPAWRAGQAVPWGVASVFAGIVATWPVLLALAMRGLR